jgi:hypothetical protein
MTATARAYLASIGLVILVGCHSDSPSELSSTGPASAATQQSETPSRPPLPTLDGWRLTKIPVDGTIQSVTEGEHGWVAVGSSPDVGIPIWFSRDGASWDAAATAPKVTGGEAVLTHVISGGAGFIATGETFLIDGGPPFAWTSPDGLHWSDAHLGDGTTLGIVSGLSHLDGRFYAGGRLGLGSGPAVIWSSVDSLSWTQTTLDTRSATGVAATAPVLFGTELVALASAATAHPGLTWTSFDGAQWAVGPDDAALRNAYVIDVKLVQGRLVAVGTIPAQDGSAGVPAIWTSDDATSWMLAYAGPCCGRVEHVGFMGNGGVAFAGNVAYSAQDGVSWNRVGRIGGFDGEVLDLIDTPTLGTVALGRDSSGTYFLVPPGS